MECEVGDTLICIRTRSTGIKYGWSYIIVDINQRSFGFDAIKVYYTFEDKNGYSFIQRKSTMDKLFVTQEEFRDMEINKLI